MAILDKLKSQWRFMLPIIIPILLLAMSLAVPTKVLIIKTDYAKTVVDYSINKDVEKARSFAQEAKKVYVSREMYLPPSEPHTTKEPHAKSPPSYTSFGIQTSQGGLSSPSPEYLNEYLKKHGLLLDNRDTCSAPAKIAIAVILLVVMLHKLICYISNVASELAPTSLINVRASSYATRYRYTCQPKWTERPL